MARYAVTYSCGHEAEVALFGPHKERERKIEWMRQSALCPACYVAARDAERQKAQADAEAKAERDGLPALLGSEKQIAWAERIRREKMDALYKLAAIADPYNGKDASMAEAKAYAEFAERIFTAALMAVEAKAEAGWWINRRDDAVTQLIRGEMRAEDVAEAGRLQAAYAAAAQARR